MDIRQVWFWLSELKGVGQAKIRRLLTAYEDDPVRIWEADGSELEALEILKHKDIVQLTSDLAREKSMANYRELLEKRVNFVVPSDPQYPSLLWELYDKPLILYYRGCLPEPEAFNVAIVGSRRCSEYGRSVAHELAYQVTLHGANVISGLAMGIDAQAHKGALQAAREGAGHTFGVLAGNVGTCYPMQNFNIYMDMIEHGGGVMAEYPDGTPTLPGMFPIRNRIISGLAQAVIVVEAGHNSGSLITASLALDQNRDIYAVPGRLGDPDGLGCNELIADGARIVCGVDRLLEDLGLIAMTRHDVREPKKNNLALAPTEKMLYSLLLDFAPKSMETLLKVSGLLLSQVYEGLVGLEIQGLIREISKNYYVRVR